MQERRHNDQLMSRLDQLYTNGYTQIYWTELYHWYNAQRLGKTIKKDLLERWLELMETKPDEERKALADPIVSEINGGIALFVAMKPMHLSQYIKI